MATRNYPDDDMRVEEGIRRAPQSGRTSARTGASTQRRSTGSAAPQQRRSASTASRSGRPAGSSRPTTSRSSASNRRPSAQTRGKRRKRRATGRFAVVVAIALVLLIAIILVIIKPFGGKKQSDAYVPASSTVQTGTAANSAANVVQSAPVSSADLADRLADSETQMGSLSASEMANVTDLSVNTALPSNWLNVLLLGTDERVLSDSARTDAMIICAINRETGEVKLASIMRDLAIEYTDIGQWNGTYRINAANYFGGPNLAMRTVNEKFNMNIQHYVMVNFFGFQKIAQRLGGVDIDITKEEMDKINIMIVQQAKAAFNAGIDESDQENVYLETYGENTHLNGRQTLAYARIRKLTGGDAMRTERQRKVLQKLLEKAKNLSPMELAGLASEMIGQVKTNVPVNDIFSLVVKVTGNGLSNMKSMHLPVNGTYKEETRNNQSMLYDCDFSANALQLYNFIYEN